MICHTTTANTNTNNVWCVYKHTSPSGKVYIGIAKKVTNGRQETCGGLHFAKVVDCTQGRLPVFEAKPVQYRKVLCVSTGQIFENISDASKSTGISRRAISYVCNGEHKTSGGLIWKFIT